LPLIDADELGPSASVPLLVTLARTVSPVFMSCTKMSATPFVSLFARFVASDVNATCDPSALIAAS